MSTKQQQPTTTIHSAIQPAQTHDLVNSLRSNYDTDISKLPCDDFDEHLHNASSISLNVSFGYTEDDLALSMSPICFSMSPICFNANLSSLGNIGDDSPSLFSPNEISISLDEISMSLDEISISLDDSLDDSELLTMEKELSLTNVNDSCSDNPGPRDEKPKIDKQWSDIDVRDIIEGPAVANVLNEESSLEQAHSEQPVHDSGTTHSDTKLGRPTRTASLEVFPVPQSPQITPRNLCNPRDRWPAEEDDRRRAAVKQQGFAGPRNQIAKHVKRTRTASLEALTVPQLPPITCNRRNPRNLWTAEEDDRLRAAVKQQGSGRRVWSEIAKHVRTRTAVQCSQRWYRRLRPELAHMNSGKWSDDEDATLRSLVNEHGTKGWRQWETISRGMDHRRNAKQCWDRWNKFLDPSIKVGVWSQEEDNKLMHLFKEHGPKWSKISKQMYGRTSPSIKRRLRALTTIMNH